MEKSLRSNNPGGKARPLKKAKVDNEEYDEYFLKTRTCKFGATCKYHHPRERYDAPPAPLNMLGFLMHQDAMNCAEDFLKSIIHLVLQDCLDDMKFISKRIDKNCTDRLQSIKLQSFCKNYLYRSSGGPE